ncbi:MAG: translation initiation factor IF-2 subunit alpha [Candidatus Altiarchaeales archaeon]|nr:translation initiation factor IF-2 subunit alpha [Candidatus Altiarchaeales archaeon]
MFPKEGEFVLGTVQSLFKQGAFITLDEYKGQRGMLHLSEISLKWVRNIRDYVKEGQKVVLLVLRVDPSRGHIDLSLRRVNEAQKKQKLQDVKQEQRSRKIVEMISAELKLKPEEVSEKVSAELLGEYPSLYKGFEAISLDKSVADKLKVPDKWKPKLVEIVCKSIKPPFVEITGFVELTSFEPNGVDVVKESLSRILAAKVDSELAVNYISAPIYRVHVRAKDYKSAERALKEASEAGIAYIRENRGVGEFHREWKKQ